MVYHSLIQIFDYSLKKEKYITESRISQAIQCTISNSHFDAAKWQFFKGQARRPAPTALKIPVN
jgi:hypothetical protein